MRARITCTECDSEYTVEYSTGCITDNIRYCVVCSSPQEDQEDPIEEEFTEDDMDL